MKEVEDVLAYLAKHLVYNYELLCQYDKNIQAKALCSLVLDAFKMNVEEREERSRFEGEMKECKRQVMESVWAFKQKFKGLQNIRKFTGAGVVDRLESILL